MSDDQELRRWQLSDTVTEEALSALDADGRCALAEQLIKPEYLPWLRRERTD